MELYPLSNPPGNDSEILYNNGGIFGADSALTWDDSASKALTIGNCAVLGLNSAVFKPNANSPTFFQVSDAAGTGIAGNFDTANIRFAVGTDTPLEAIHISKAGNQHIQITSTDHSDVGLILHRTGNGYNDWKIVNNGGFLKFQQSIDDGSSWLDCGNMLVISGTDPTWNAPQVVATSAKYPVVDIIRTTTLGSSIYAAAKLQRTMVQPAVDGSGIGFFFETENDADESVFAGMFGGALADVSDGAEVGALIFAAAYQDTDPASYNHFTIVATSASAANIGVNEPDPETPVELTHATPYITKHCDTHVNNLGRISQDIAKGEKLDGTEHTLVITEVGHDGTGDDYGAYWRVSTHTKAIGGGVDAVTEALRIDSGQAATFAAAVKITGNVGFFNTTPVAQESHIIDADGTLADITTKFNTLLFSLETYGLLAAA